MSTWLITLALLTAANAAPTDSEIVALTGEAFGKDLPAKAVCIYRDVMLPEEFEGDPIPVGLMHGNEGCRIFGVILKGYFVPVERAALASVNDDAWSAANGRKRGDLLLAWTTNVLVAFDQFDIRDPRPVHTPGSNGRTRVETSIWQRTHEKHVAKHTRAIFTFANDAALESVDRDQGDSWKSTFTVRESRVEGVSVAAVMSALKTRGRSLAKCMDQAWKENLTISGRTRFQWTIRAGKATQIALVAEDDDGSGIASCYHRALQSIDFPPELGGQVVWSFNIVRNQVLDK